MDRLIYLSMSGAKATMQRQETLAHNLANVSTPGFRAELQAFRAVPFHNQFAACTAAFTEAGIARKQGISDLEERIERTWLKAAEAALAKNTSTFATLPISQLLKADGYLSRLQAKGYMVEAPE